MLDELIVKIYYSSAKGGGSGPRLSLLYCTYKSRILLASVAMQEYPAGTHIKGDINLENIVIL